MSDAAAPKSQDELRNLFFKRPANDAGLPPPKAAEPLPPAAAGDGRGRANAVATSSPNSRSSRMTPCASVARRA